MNSSPALSMSTTAMTAVTLSLPLVAATGLASPLTDAGWIGEADIYANGSGGVTFSMHTEVPNPHSWEGIYSSAAAQLDYAEWPPYGSYHFDFFNPASGPFPIPWWAWGLAGIDECTEGWHYTFGMMGAVEWETANAVLDSELSFAYKWIACPSS